MVQQYNISFAKSEKVYDMDKLLGIPHNHWTVQYAQQAFAPIPVSHDDKAIRMTLKEVTMPEFTPERHVLATPSCELLRKGDEKWVFGTWYDPSEAQWGISSDNIYHMLQFGSPDDQENNSINTTATTTPPSVTVTATTDKDVTKTTTTSNAPTYKQSSLSKALWRASPGTTSGSSSSGRNSGDGDPIPIRKKQIVKCKFYANGSCRYGVHCRFSHE
jgi:hypothetical protein